MPYSSYLLPVGLIVTLSFNLNGLRTYYQAGIIEATEQAGRTSLIAYSNPLKEFRIQVQHTNPLMKTDLQVQDTSPVVAAGAQLQKISDQFKFTEGPARDKQGNVFFTDQPNNTIWKYDTRGKLTLFMSGTGRSNGLYIDKNNNILSCADENNEIWRISPKKRVTVLVKGFDGKRFNGPNDLWPDASGGIYFTDPFYKRDYWNHSTQEQPGMYLYYFDAASEKVSIVDTGFQRPNGIIGTADGRTLYVADIGGNKTYRYRITANGQLTDKQLFVSQGSDGMTLDTKGNLYLTGKGVTVYNPEGEKIAHIAVPANWTANCCFGGKNRDVLFITASESVFTLQMKVKGV